MSFSSVVFLLYFFPLSLVLYFIFPQGIRDYVLFFLSLLFYAWGEPQYVILLVVSIAVNYGVGMLISWREDALTKKLALMAGVIADIGILIFFKYSDFFISSINALIIKMGLSCQMKLIGVTLPIGVSFFVFQEVSYIIDVYRGKNSCQKNFFKLGLYVSMFPQLVAGPIVRYQDIALQIDDHKSTLDDIYCGFRRFIVGLTEKVMLADILANVSNKAFSNANYAGGVEPSVAWLGAIAYTLQILFDFSGYSNMAIGMARIFGFKLTENFDKPYISKSMTEFWRRWHISLGTWFKDYVYIPIGGNRTGNIYVNLLVVFALTGLWHGAAWNFVVWGLYHGFFVIIERVIHKHVKVRVPSIIMWVYTMLIVIFGWVLFGTESLDAALNYLQMMFGSYELPKFIPYNIQYYMDNQIIATMLVGIIVCTGVYKTIWNELKERLFIVVKGSRRIFNAKQLSIIFSCMTDIILVLLFLMDIAMIVNGNYSPFIYFRF